jgi:hypothetical protein
MGREREDFGADPKMQAAQGQSRAPCKGQRRGTQKKEQREAQPAGKAMFHCNALVGQDALANKAKKLSQALARLTEAKRKGAAELIAIEQPRYEVSRGLEDFTAPHGVRDR